MKDEYVSKEAVLKYIRKVAETAYGDCKDAIGDAYNYLADDLEMHIIRPSIVKPPEGEYISKKKAVDELCFDYAYAAAEIIKKMPGIDAAPVVHGRWLEPRKELPPDGEEVLVLTQSKKGIRNIDKGYWAIDHFIHRGTAQVIGWMKLPDMYLTEEEGLYTATVEVEE